MKGKVPRTTGTKQHSTTTTTGSNNNDDDGDNDVVKIITTTGSNNGRAFRDVGDKKYVNGQDPMLLTKIQYTKEVCEETIKENCKLMRRNQDLEAQLEDAGNMANSCNSHFEGLTKENKGLNQKIEDLTQANIQLKAESNRRGRLQERD